MAIRGDRRGYLCCEVPVPGSGEAGTSADDDRWEAGQEKENIHITIATVAQPFPDLSLMARAGLR